MENGRTRFLKGEITEKVSIHNVKDYIGTQQEKKQKEAEIESRQRKEE